MEMLWMLAAVIVVLYLSYRCSRFIAVRGSGFAGASANEMRLLSRLSLGQDKQLAFGGGWRTVLAVGHIIGRNPAHRRADRGASRALHEEAGKYGKGAGIS